MKKIMLLLAAVGIAFFVSCDKEPKEEPKPFPIGTHWIAESYVRQGGERKPIREGDKYELIFTSENEVSCIIKYTYRDGEDNYSIDGTYEYSHPKISFKDVKLDIGDFLSQIGVCDGESGTVTGNTMIVGMFLYGDVVQDIEFRRQ